jgi:hypothetical protein
MWKFHDTEYDYTPHEFKQLITDIQAGNSDMTKYNELLAQGRVPAVNPMAFNRGSILPPSNVRLAIAHNGGQYVMEEGDDPWKGWTDGWLPPVDPPREHMGIE